MQQYITLHYSNNDNDNNNINVNTEWMLIEMFIVWCFYTYFVLLDAGKQFEVITSSSADVFKQEQVGLLVCLVYVLLTLCGNFTPQGC